MTGRELYRDAKQRLAQAGKPAFDAACLIEKHLHLRHGELPLHGGEPVDEATAQAFREDVERRAADEPLQYLMGEWEFYGLAFAVGPGVLIPRPETELLAETAIAFFKGRPGGRLLELCAGSGCVTIAAAKATGCEAVCLEFSDQALPYLRQNLAAHGLEKSVRAVRGDMLAGPQRVKEAQGPFDALLCNPPYIPSGELASLQPEVRREPPLALDGGPDGLRFYRALPLWFPCLSPGALVACEVGMGEAQDVAALLAGAGLSDVTIKDDFAGIGRLVCGHRP